jgi:hypothetical protein
VNYYIGCDAHKRYPVFVTVNETGKASSAERVGHERDVYRKYLSCLPPGSPIAIKSVGNWYWMLRD